MSTLSAARGGILSGPISGYQATLHGTEAVIPLASGQSVPVNMEPLSRGIQAQTELMNIQLAKLDELIMAMQDNAGTSKKILQRTK
jgi:hypothetical protein